jgi:hypothetical protein
MDLYLVLRYLHFIGFILLGGGLAAVFVSEWRGYGATRAIVFSEAACHTALLYDFVVVPGAAIQVVVGPLLVWKLGLGYFDLPWLTGMWGLFLFELVEGNTLTRAQFQRTLRIARSWPEDRPVTEAARREAQSFIGRLAHFLDIPIVLTIVFLGITRTGSWLTVGLAIGVAIAAAIVLVAVVPRLAEVPVKLVPAVAGG